VSLHVITGPMRSGKTAELIRLVRQASAEGRETRVFVHELGVQRDDGRLWSRNGESIKAVPVRSVVPILDAMFELRGTDALIAVDEAHFFTWDDAGLIARRSDWCTLVVAGLDSDFRGEPFDVITRLQQYAWRVTSLPATCARCGAPATRTQRLIDGQPAPWTSPVIVPGGDDMYEPRCVACHEVPGRPGVSVGG